jgi:predicted amidohydrolase
MGKVKIGLIQTKVSSDKSANLEKTAKMIRQAAKRGAEIICLQELFATLYFPIKRNIDVRQFAEPVPGPTTELMANLAKELKVVIIVPFCERTKNGKFYNTVVVFDERGKNLGRYHKIHIPHDPGFYEKDYFEHGNLGYKVFKTKYGKFAVLICYDQWFPEAARAARLAGAEIIFYPTAIGDIMAYEPPEGDWHESWEIIQRSHAIANIVHVAVVNRVGVEGKTRFWGQSFVADAFGKMVGRLSSAKEEVLIATLDLGLNKFVADGWGFLRNRRPGTYKSLITNKLVESSKKLKNIAHYKDTKRALAGK